MWHWLTGAVKYGMWRGNWKVEKITLMFEDIQNSAYELSILPLIFAVLTHFFTSCLLVSVIRKCIKTQCTIFDLPFIYFFSHFILDMQIHTVSSSYIFHKVIYLYCASPLVLPSAAVTLEFCGLGLPTDWHFPTALSFHLHLPFFSFQLTFQLLSMLILWLTLQNLSGLKSSPFNRNQKKPLPLLELTQLSLLIPDLIQLVAVFTAQLTL